MSSLPCFHRLLSHEHHKNSVVDTLKAAVFLSKSGEICFSYHLQGGISHLLIPPLSASKRSDGLWQHTCFEAFVSVEGRPHYYEFNFSPSRAWAIYYLSAYRAPLQMPDIMVPPKIEVLQNDHALIINAYVHLDELFDLKASASLLIGLCAVIEGRGGEKSYWALHHEKAQPDFHDREGFILPLHLQES